MAHSRTEKMTGRQKSLILSILSQLRIGADMTKILIPVDFLESRSLTERITDFYTHGQLITDSCAYDNSVDRMVAVLKWYLSCWHMLPTGVKKPYNPILGEIYRCNFELDDGSITTYFAEQVSHHPPITAIHAENKKHNVEMNGWYYPRSKFLGNSAASCAEGHMILEFKDQGEKYEITLPDFYARGIIFGKVTMEVCGKTHIQSLTSGLRADIEFKAKPFIGGEYDRIEAKVTNNGKELYRIKGKWSSDYVIKKTGEDEWKPFLDCHNAPCLRRKDIPKEHLLANDAYVVWRYLTRAIRRGIVEDAATEKERVEKRQREIQKERDQKKIVYKPKFFEKSEDGKDWIWIGENAPEYKILLNPINSVEYEEIRSQIQDQPFFSLYPQEDIEIPSDPTAGFKFEPEDSEQDESKEEEAEYNEQDESMD